VDELEPFTAGGHFLGPGGALPWCVQGLFSPYWCWYCYMVRMNPDTPCGVKHGSWGTIRDVNIMIFMVCARHFVKMPFLYAPGTSHLYLRTKASSVSNMAQMAAISQSLACLLFLLPVVGSNAAAGFASCLSLFRIEFRVSCMRWWDCCRCG
jgi:hypothetical protein